MGDAAPEQGGPEGIAVVGMAGRFPGAGSISELWENLRDGVESIAQISDEELLAAGVDPRLLADPRYVRARGALHGADLFDPAFFGMSPREAAITDPQQRVFLECAWEAMEHAGYDPARIEGPVGVFAGAGASGYWLHHVAPSGAAETSGDLAALIGNDKDHLTTRVAFKLGLRGPAITVQTACSTALVAVQLACQSLLGYQCDMALAGGVSIGFPRNAGHLYQEGGILSPDGRCRAFDARARGTVNGDGAGVVVLKRLADALADGDTVHAVILAAAVNNDGSFKAGYTAPSVDGQAEVISMAHALGQVDPGTIGYVEAHGTGTALGDPIEVAALAQAFRAGTAKRGVCALGSIKPNIGHLNTAAGIAGLVKAVLALRHEAIPPTLHFTAPNPEIDFESSPFFVNSRLHPWPRGEAPRRAGISSFGFGGTNAHVVIEEAPVVPAEPSRRPAHLLVLSARSERALDAVSARLAEHLTAHGDLEIADVAFTLQVGRRAFEHRRAVVCTGIEDAIAALREPRSGRTLEGAAQEAAPGVVMMFPGQGAQHARMAEELYRSEPVFRRHVDRCASILRPHLGLDLRDVLYPPGGADDGRLAGTALAQPAIFVVEYALSHVLLGAGVSPRAMIGHSLGEYVAATLAGVMSPEDALALVAERGRLMAALPAGAMLSVPLPEAELLPLLGGALSLAVINGPSSTVASGPVEAIEALERRLSDMGVEGRRLRASHAFHSAMMEPILGAFAERVRKVRLSAPRIPFVSNVTGTWITPAQATDPAYWARHLRETVRFSAGVDELLRGPAAALLEVGPGRALSALIEARRAPSHRAIPCLARPGSRDLDTVCVLEAIGRLWADGATIDWSALHADERRRRVPLPAYPFERQRCWIDAAPAGRGDVPAPGRGDGAAAGKLDVATGEALFEEERRHLQAREAALHVELAIRAIEDYPGLVETLDRFCASHVCAYLRESGVDVGGTSVEPASALRRRLGIVPKLSRLYDAFIGILAEDGVLVVEGGDVRFTGRAREIEPPAVIRRALDERYPQFRGLFDFVDHCARSHRDALAGRVEAIGVLYPGGSTELIDRVERTTVEHRSERVYIALLAEAARRIAEASPGKRLRVLEVGGGQGLLTWPLVSALEGHLAEYRFTDLGRVFVDDARAEAARRGLDGAMTFGVLDASRDPVQQGYEQCGFDLIAAFNVVHATRDVGATLDHLATLLAPGGTLALVELVKVRRWDVLTWGLAEGWWYHADEHRKGSPLLPLATWEEVLRGRGFRRVDAYPGEDGRRAGTDHGLLLARGHTGATAHGERSVHTDRALRGGARQAPDEFAGLAKVGGRAALAPRPALRVPYVAPRSDVERRIAAICGELLGVESVGVRDDFFELGADSLIMLRLTDRLRRELGREIPAQVAFRGATVERIAKALAGERDTVSASPAVPIQPEGSRPPLFFVHPAAGVVFPYVELARRLGPDQPFYGLQALGLDGVTEPDQTIEEMARHYVEAIRAVAPGPYYIGGFSFGCLVAFEMAQQLVAAGDEVAFLGMVDEPAPVFGHRPSPLIMAELLATGIAKSIWPYLHDYFYLANAAEERAANAGGGPPGDVAEGRAGDGEKRRGGREVIESLLARATIANYVPRESRLLALRQPAMVPMFRLFNIHLRETLAYRARAYPHRITYFRATRLRGRKGEDPTQGWGLLAAGGVDVHEVPGEHLTVLRRPHVEVLAEKLGACLARVRRRSG